MTEQYGFSLYENSKPKSAIIVFYICMYMTETALDNSWRSNFKLIFIHLVVNLWNSKQGCNVEKVEFLLWD